MSVRPGLAAISFTGQKDLRYLIEENLDSSSVEETGIFNVSAVEKIKIQFFNDQLDDLTIIWKLLQFQMWYKKWMY